MTQADFSWNGIFLFLQCQRLLTSHISHADFLLRKFFQNQDFCPDKCDLRLKNLFCSKRGFLSTTQRRTAFFSKLNVLPKRKTFALTKS